MPIRNDGEGTPILRRVNTGRGAPRVRFPGQLPPGSAETLHVAIPTRGYAGETLAREIVFRTNDPERRRAEVKIEVTVTRSQTFP